VSGQTEARLGIRIQAPSLSDPQRESFIADAKSVHAVLDDLRSRLLIPATDLELVVTDDFTATVRASQADSEEPFDVERPFGLVSAKNLPQDDKSARVVIVFDARAWSGLNVAKGQDRWRALGLIAHELAHPILTRARWASGVLEGVAYPSHTPTELARSISRIGSDEYRADAIADIVLKTTTTKTVDGVSSPALIWDVMGQDYREGMRDLFRGLYPQLPDLVQAYRERRLDLEPMWREIVRQSEGIVTAFMHARAYADAADDIPLLDADEIRHLPAVTLYLADTMPPYIEAVRTGPMLAPLPEFAALDARVIRAGEGMLREIWRRLGLTFTEVPGSRNYEIHVAEPFRWDGSESQR